MLLLWCLQLSSIELAPAVDYDGATGRRAPTCIRPLFGGRVGLIKLDSMALRGPTQCARNGPSGAPPSAPLPPPTLPICFPL